MQLRSSKILIPTALTLLVAMAIGPVSCTSLAPRQTREEVDQSAEEALQAAQAARDEGDIETALAEFERAIRINPRLTVAHLGIGDIYREQGRIEAAEPRYATAADLEPENFDAQYLHGLVLQMLERTAEAIAAYLRALSIIPTDPQANLNLATAYLQVGEPNQALPYAERAVAYAPDLGAAHANLGAVHARLGRHNEAVDAYQQAIDLLGPTEQVLLNLADSLGRSGRYEEMEEAARSLIAIDRTGLSRERLGYALFRQGRYDEAEAAFRDAIEVDPQHYPAHNGVAVCLLNTYVWGDRVNETVRKDAISHLRTSLRLQPDQPRIVELISRYN